jgi:hypothetical protein
MRILHEPSVRDSIRARLHTLSPNATQQWGKMSVDQMLFHCNQAMRAALGEYTPKAQRVPMPKSLLKFMVLNLPWVKGAPTTAEFVACEQYSFDAERDRLLQLIDEFTTRSVDATSWGRSAAFGDMSGREWSRLQAKHLDHHLRQFNV